MYRKRERRKDREGGVEIVDARWRMERRKRERRGAKETDTTGASGWLRRTRGKTWRKKLIGYRAGNLPAALSLHSYVLRAQDCGVGSCITPLRRRRTPLFRRVRTTRTGTVYKASGLHASSCTLERYQEKEGECDRRKEKDSEQTKEWDEREKGGERERDRKARENRAAIKRTETGECATLIATCLCMCTGGTRVPPRTHTDVTQTQRKRHLTNKT